jgi:hypothetical protein
MPTLYEHEREGFQGNKKRSRGLGLNLVLSSLSASQPPPSSLPPPPPSLRGPSLVRFTQQSDEELHNALNQRHSPSIPSSTVSNSRENYKKSTGLDDRNTQTRMKMISMEEDDDDEEEVQRDLQSLPTAAYVASRLRKSRENVLPIPLLFSRRVTSVVESMQETTSPQNDTLPVATFSPSVKESGFSSAHLAALKKWEEFLAITKQTLSSSTTTTTTTSSPFLSSIVSDLAPRVASAKKAAVTAAEKSLQSLSTPEKEFLQQGQGQGLVSPQIPIQSEKKSTMLQNAYDTSSIHSIELLFKHSERIVLTPRLLGSKNVSEQDIDDDLTPKPTLDECVFLPRFSTLGSSIQGFLDVLINDSKNELASIISNLNSENVLSHEKSLAYAFSLHVVRLWQLLSSLFSTMSSGRSSIPNIDTQVLCNILCDPELLSFAQEAEVLAKESLSSNTTSLKISSRSVGHSRTEALSQWLQSSLSIREKKSNQVHRTFGELFDAIFDALSRRDLFEASRLALLGDQPILSSLVTQGGSDKNACVFLQRQLRQWRASSVFSKKLLSCYSLLAGPDEDDDGVSTDISWLNEVKGSEISWLQSLGLFLWYSGENLSSPEHAIASYTAAVERNLVSVPLPWWRALEGDYNGGVMTFQEEKERLKKQFGLRTVNSTDSSSSSSSSQEDILRLAFASSPSLNYSDLRSQCTSAKIKVIQEGVQNNQLFLSPPRDALYLLLRLAVQGERDPECLSLLLSPFSHCPDVSETRLSFLLYTILRSLQRQTKTRIDLDYRTSLTIQADFAATSVFHHVNSFQQNVLQQLARDLPQDQFEDLKTTCFSERWNTVCLLFQSKEVFLSQPLLSPSLQSLSHDEYLKFALSCASRFEESNNNDWPSAILSLLSAAGQALEDVQICKIEDDTRKKQYELTCRILLRAAIAVLCRHVPSSTSLLSKQDASTEDFFQKCNYFTTLGWPLPSTWLAYAVAVKGVQDASIPVALPALISLLKAGGGSPLIGLVSLAEEDGGQSRRFWALSMLKSLIETEILPSLLIPIVFPLYYSHNKVTDNLYWQGISGGSKEKGGILLYSGPGGILSNSANIFGTRELFELINTLDTEILGSSLELQDSWNSRGRVFSSLFSIGNVIKVIGTSTHSEYVRRWAVQVYKDEQELNKQGGGIVTLRENTWPTTKVSLQRLRGLLLAIERRLED